MGGHPSYKLRYTLFFACVWMLAYACADWCVYVFVCVCVHSLYMWTYGCLRLIHICFCILHIFSTSLIPFMSAQWVLNSPLIKRYQSKLNPIVWLKQPLVMVVWSSDLYTDLMAMNSNNIWAVGIQLCYKFFSLPLKERKRVFCLPTSSSSYPDDTVHYTVQRNFAVSA